MRQRARQRPGVPDEARRDGRACQDKQHQVEDVHHLPHRQQAVEAVWLSRQQQRESPRTHRQTKPCPGEMFDASAHHAGM